MNLKTISINEIYPDDNQPRKLFDDEALERLSTSIRDNGIEQPIAVRKNGNGYVIIDGERRWRASKTAGIKEIPCMVVDKDNQDDILEMQLRSDCLKEGLTVDELDRAIYRYYDQLSTSGHLKREQKDNGFRFISRQIGKSVTRVTKAIDRFEFKRDNQEFVQQITKDHNPKDEKYKKVNATIAMTDKLKKTPEVRKAVISSILEDRKSGNIGLDNEKIRSKVNEIVKRDIDNPEDAKAVLADIKAKENQSLKSNPQFVFSEIYFKFNAIKDEFEKLQFENVREHLGTKQVAKFINDVEDFLIQLQNLRG